MVGPVSGCRACGGRLTVTMADLGLQPASNAFIASLADARDEKRYPLRAKVCESCKLVQVDYDVAPQELFGNYVYFSSYSDDWLAHAKAYCEMARRRFGLGKDSLVVELASNDGYLLKNFIDMGVPVLGIDPSDTVAAAAEKIGVPTLVEFFGEGLAKQLVADGRQADLIIANNVLAHVPLLNDFVAGIARLLKSDGTATIEFPHLLELIEHVEFDTIYHEHYSYFSLYAIEQVFSRHGLRLYDAERLPTHGGSLRIYASHSKRADLEDSAQLLRAARRGERGGPGRSCHLPAFRGTRRELPAILAEVSRGGEARRQDGRGVWRRGEGQYAAQFLRRDAGRYSYGGGPQSAQAVEIPAGHAHTGDIARGPARGEARLRADPAVESAGGDSPTIAADQSVGRALRHARARGPRR